MKQRITHLLAATVITVAGLIQSAHAANIAKGDVTTTLWPGGAPYTFFDNAATGGADSSGTTLSFDRSFGTLNVGSGGTKIVVSGIGWASAAGFTATNVIVTVTYLGANGTNDTPTTIDDVVIGKATNNVTADATAGEWAWVFDAPLTNIVDGVSNMFRITMTRVGTGTMTFKGTSAGVFSTVKLSAAGSTTAVGAGDPTLRKWVGNVDGTWNTGTANWSDGVASQTYADGKNVTFDDSLNPSPLNNSITLGGTYAPLSVLANNTTYSYALSGGGLAGAMALTKQGTNIFALGMSNSYSGLTTISAGTLLLSHSNALGSVIAGTVVASGASLALSNGVTLSGEPLTLNGNGTAGNNGALRTVDAVNPVTVAAPITLGSNGRIAASTDGGELILAGPITDDGSHILLLDAGQTGSKLRINTSGNMSVSNVTVYTYLTTAGLITFGADNAFPSAILNVGAGLFDLKGTSQTFGGLGQGFTPLNGVITNSSSTPSTLTINWSRANATNIASAISGNINVVKEGTGNQIFSGGTAVKHTYTGTTTINGGILSLSSDMSGVTGTIFVNNGATLRGAATASGIGGSVVINNGGLYYPGSASNNIGNAVINGNFTLNSGATMIATINPDLMVSNSSVAVGGTLTYGGKLIIYSIGHTNALQAGQTFRIFPPGGVGSFSETNFNTIESQPGTTVAFADGLVTVTAAPAPTLTVTPLGGNVMQINWDSSFYKLQQQTNALSTGLSGNWVDFASGRNLSSTNVVNDPTIPATFYRLAPKP